MNTGKLLVISGPSGAGKGTICHELFSDIENLAFSVSMTTREPRNGEVHGKNYYFTDKKNFEYMIEKGEFLEYAKVFDNYYGTPKKMVTDKLAAGKDVLLEIDVQGAMQVKKSYPQAVLIFVLPPSIEELKRRIIGRGTESEESLRKRLGEAVNEISYASRYEYVIVNEDLNKAVENVEAIISAEHAKVTEKTAEIIAKYRKEI